MLNVSRDEIEYMQGCIWRRCTMRKIIPYTLKTSRIHENVWRSSRKQYSRAPRWAYHPKSPLELARKGRRRAERGVKARGSRRARNPSWHHLSATLNTRWFIHEDSLTAITLIRLINGCSRGEMGRRTYTENKRKREEERGRERKLQRYSNGRYISEAYAATTPATSHFSLFFFRIRRGGARKICAPKKRGTRHRQKGNFFALSSRSFLIYMYRTVEIN